MERGRIGDRKKRSKRGEKKRGKENKATIVSDPNEERGRRGWGVRVGGGYSRPSAAERQRSGGRSEPALTKADRNSSVQSDQESRIAAQSGISCTLSREMTLNGLSRAGGRIGEAGDGWRGGRGEAGDERSEWWRRKGGVSKRRIDDGEDGWSGRGGLEGVEEEGGRVVE